MSDAVVYGAFHPTRIATTDILLAADGRTIPVQAAVLIACLLRFALVNHRSNDRRSTRLWRQVIWIAGAMVLGAAAFTAAQMLALQR